MNTSPRQPSASESGPFRANPRQPLSNPQNDVEQEIREKILRDVRTLKHTNLHYMNLLQKWADHENNHKQHIIQSTNATSHQSQH